MVEVVSFPGMKYKIILFMKKFYWNFSVDQEIVNRTFIVTPGHLSTYDRDSLEVGIEVWKYPLSMMISLGWT